MNRSAPMPDTAADPRWADVCTRNKAADGRFWYAVTTTGVYCRPSCPSRLANPGNVILHDTLESARASGLRPCKRCNPEGASADALNAALVEQACRLIESAQEPLTTGDLAAAVELSPGHFHRLFRAGTGLTPKAYADAHRARRVREHLARGSSVTEAIHAAGFQSSGRFHQRSGALIGMSAGRYRRGGAQEVLRFAVGECWLGTILVASSSAGVVSILLGDAPEALLHDLEDRFPNADLIGGDPEYEGTVARIVALVGTPEVGLDLPLDVRGTAFQQRVWQALRAIPAGQTLTYAEVASRIGAPAATRAVAGACAANPLAIAIPCHRVIRTDGALSGYRWGIDRKRALLLREAAGRPAHDGLPADARRPGAASTPPAPR